jgi:hypothetical protein
LDTKKTEKRTINTLTKMSSTLPQDNDDDRLYATTTTVLFGEYTHDIRSVVQTSAY